MIAKIVYWYSEATMRSDGGGRRVQAWCDSLRNLGFTVEVVPLWTSGGGHSSGELLSELKRKLVPMPFSRPIPAGVLDADIVVAAVPAVFPSILRLDNVKTPVILDWMDLWSVNSRNIGDASIASFAGGRVQSRFWRRIELTAWRSTHTSCFAGYGDFNIAETLLPKFWLPTPVAWQGRPVRRTESVLAGGRRVRLGFIGNFFYPPNLLSLKEFVQHQWLNREDRLERFELCVAGYGVETLESLGWPISVMGEVEDVSDFYEVIDAALVPVTHGGGIKVKAVEALSHGLPVFVSEHVREGFPPVAHSYLHNLEDAFDTDTSFASCMDEALFLDLFSEESFARTVSEILKQNGTN